MRLARVLAVMFAIAYLSVLTTHAQQLPVEQGIKPYGSYEGGEFDSISMTNGGLTLHIPIASYPQRGGRLHLQFELNYVNPRYTFTNNQVNGVCPAKCYTWHISGGAIVLGPDLPGLGTSTTSASINYTVADGDGAAHPMGQLASSKWISTDATGYVFNSTGTSCTSTYAGYLSDRQGTQYSFNGNCSPYVVPQAVTQIRDINGNLITSSLNPNNSAQILSFTDTMGRVIPDLGQSTSDYSGCTGTYTTSSAVIWAFPGPNGGTSQFKVCYGNFPLNYNPGCFGYPQSLCYGLSGYKTEIQSIVLPNSTAWTFFFDTTGALTKITLPTGGSIAYTWTPYNLSSSAPVIDTFMLAATSRTTDATDGSGPHTWQYVIGTWGSGSIPNYQSVATDPNGNDAVHTLTAIGYLASAPTNSFYETQLDQYSGTHTSGNKLRTTVTAYAPPSLGQYNGSAINVVPTSITTTDVLSGKSSQALKTWDSGVALTGNQAGLTAIYGDMLSENDYDFTGSLLRTTSNSYMALSGPNASSYLSKNLLSLPYTVQIKNGSGSQLSLSQYNYDETAPASAGLNSSNQFNPAGIGTYRGNNTSIYRWLNTTNSTDFACPNGYNGNAQPYMKSTKTYFDDGMLNTSADPCGNTTTYGYNLTYWGALPTTVTNALGQATTNIYDFNTALLTSTTDPNSLQTSYSYDPMWRLAQVNHPDGGQDTITHQETTFPFTATITSKINGTQNKIETNVFDGFGRVAQHQLTSDPQGTVYTDTTYDALGRVATVSNPYRTGTDATTTTGITTYGYDALSRKITVTYPQTGTGTSVLITAYCGPSTLVTDPTGKWRRSRVDGLGRLVEVDEPNSPTASVNSSGCPGTGEPIWVTSYTNDALGNLTNVVQNGSHTRSFTYDSLSRLLCSSNPENSSVSCPAFGGALPSSGAVVYAYNPDGTVLKKTDARGITANYTYEALLRTTGVTYSNGDPSLSFSYDQGNCLSLSACQNIGHRTSMTDGAGSEAWVYQVDSANLRSIHRDQRTTSGITTTTYYLDLAGNVTQLQYPTGRIVNYAYDAADRPASAADSANGITYASDWQTPPANTACTGSAVCYTPQGSIYGMATVRNSVFAGINILETYNNRLQPLEIKAWSPSTWGTALDLTYNFTDPASGGNAGVVYGITNNLNAARTQTFGYDQLNRITSAGTNSTSGTYCWGYQYSYDAWGNLLSQAGWSPNYNACSQSNMGGVSADGADHISGFSYDPAGNTVNDGVYSYTWDGESQLKTANGVTYSYDGDGRRAAKVGSKLYWYGSGGEILSETDAAGNLKDEYVFFAGKRVAMVPATGEKEFYIEDMLGSSRLVANGSAVCYDADFTPFGGERAYTNTCTQNNYKFEGKERDAETQNDDFGAREYSWRFGRWLSSDWSSTPEAVPYANLTNPQTLNLYAMVSDDPESFADLDGHRCDLCAEVEESLKELVDRGAAEGAEMIEAASSKGLAVAGQAVGVIGTILLSPEPLNSGEHEALQKLHAEEDAARANQDAHPEPSTSSDGAMKGNGRGGRQKRLRELAEDEKINSAHSGWLKNEKRQVSSGNRTSLRVPPGTELAHRRGQEARKGYDYSRSDLQEKALHKTQHQVERRYDQD